MDNKIKRRRIYPPTTRRLAQLYCALLYNANLKGFAEGKIYSGNTKAVCVPGLNCYSCPGAVGACPLGALQNALASSGTRAGTYIFGILMLFGVMLGRTVCGWLCPMGMFQELLHKIPGPKIRKSRVTRALSWLKYGILAYFVIAMPLWYGFRKGLPLPGFCKYICPAGTFEGALALLANPKNSSLFETLGALFANKLVILLILAAACIFCYRSFCRFICPLGAVYGFFSRLAVIGVKVDQSKCTNCGACVRFCKMDVQRVGDHECIHCGECRKVCRDCAISLKAGGIELMPPELSGRPKTGGSAMAEEEKKIRNRRRVLQVSAFLVLVGALFYYNVFLPRQEGASEQQDISESAVLESSIASGSGVGEQLPDFSAEIIGGGEFHLEETRGNAVFINLWATYCTPCIEELPSFNRLKEEHPEVSILAVHSGMTIEDIPEYLSKKDWNLDFCVDSEDNRIFDLVGGSALLPQTIVLDAEGVVVYNQTGSVTFEKLEELYDMAQKQQRED